MKAVMHLAGQEFSGVRELFSLPMLVLMLYLLLRRKPRIPKKECPLGFSGHLHFVPSCIFYFLTFLPALQIIRISAIQAPDMKLPLRMRSQLICRDMNGSAI